MEQTFCEISERVQGSQTISEKQDEPPTGAREGHAKNMSLPLRRAHAFVEEACESDAQSSIASTPFDSKRHSLIEELTTEEEVVAYAAGIPLPSDSMPNEHSQSVGPLMSPIIAPKNFGSVAKGIYRCGFPQPENFSFLRCLRLKTILTLVHEGYTDEHCQFVNANGIQHFQVQIRAHKKKEDKIGEECMLSALKELSNPNNYPLLVHCNRGKHRTGCVVAAFRKILGWEMSAIVAEYRQYAGAKARELDIEYIKGVDARGLCNKLALLANKPRSGLVVEPHMESVVNGPRVGSTRLRS